MNKRLLKHIVLMSVVGGSALTMAHEFRTPLSLVRGTMHYPLMHTMDKQDDNGWMIEVWAAGYGRQAHEGFFKSGCANGKEKTTTCASEEGLTRLFFGKDSFRGEEAFAGGQQIVPNNPWMSFAQITPRVTFSEKGGFLGLMVDKQFEDSKWHLGGRASIPYKLVEVRRTLCAKLEETLDDVIAKKVEDEGSGKFDTSFAYRLDFLTSLQLQALNGSQSIVKLGNSDATPSIATTIANVTVSGDGKGVGIDVIKSQNGSVPAATIAFGAAALTTALPETGDASDGARLYFRQNDATPGFNYADKLNRAAQGTLWVVPQTASDAIVPQAKIIQNAVDQMLAVLDVTGHSSAEKFFADNDISFCDKRVGGVGDLRLELMTGYRFRENLYLDLMVGAGLPTSKKPEHAGDLFHIATGHHGHFGLMVGLEGGWKPLDWMAIKIDGSYMHMFRRAEKKAAPFTGATVRNIGPTIDLNVAWDEFEAHADFSFFHPDNENLGANIGYEFFAKRKDKISQCGTTSTVKDLLGNPQELDLTILEKGSNLQAHKVRGQFFHRWDYCELFMGSSLVFAGKNAMKERECHLGVAVSF